MAKVDRLAWIVLMVSALFGGCGRTEQPEAVAEDAGQTAQLARGQYLVEHVGICLYCHSQIDWNSPGYPQVAGTQGGGAVFPDKAVPGRSVARNITPAALRDCTDEQIARAIREGVACDGSRLFPVMPYLLFHAMSDDDVAAVVAYLRTLPAVQYELPPQEIVEEAWASVPPPQPITEPVRAPDPSDKVAYGGYLATIGLCFDCHTPVDRTGAPLPGMALAGGRILDGPWGRVASANLTPDDSGIPYYDEALFKEVLRTCQVKGRQLNHIMPCAYFAGLTDDDLSALFAFLRSLPPIAHNTSNVDEPTPCPLCGATHGLGATNHPAEP